MDDRSKKLAFAICQHLKDNLATVSKDSVEGIEVAIQCIGEAFGVDPDADSKYSIKPANLASIFEVFMANQQRMGDQEDAAAANAKAEGLKADGNKKMAARDYAGAIALYSQAIDLAPNAVFYSNRYWLRYLVLLLIARRATTHRQLSTLKKLSKSIPLTLKLILVWDMHTSDWVILKPP